MRLAIIYASVHHGNTKKILDHIQENCEIELIDATEVKTADLSLYDAVGFASGIYYGKLHRSVLAFAKANLPDCKKIFLIYSYGARRNYADTFMKAVAEKKAELTGVYGCLGFDTFGPFGLVGGIAKGHPDEKDLAGAAEFVDRLIEDLQ